MIIDFFTANFWATCTLVASFVTMVTSILIKWLKPNGVWKQVISWVVSIGLTVGCYFAGIITVASPIWLTLILTGLVVGIASNGIYDIPTIKEYVNKFALYITTWNNIQKSNKE